MARVNSDDKDVSMPVSAAKNNSVSGEKNIFENQIKKPPQDILPLCCDFFPQRNQVLLN